MTKILPGWGIDPILPKFKTLGGRDYFLLWSSLGVGLLVFSAGSLLSDANAFTAIFAIIVGSIIGSLLLGLAGKIGSDCSIPSIITIRPSLGIYGSYVPSILNVIQLIGWTTFEIMVMSKAADLITGSYLPMYLWNIIFGVIIAVMGLIGPVSIIRQWIGKFAIWVVYASSAILLFSFVMSRPDFIVSSGQGDMSFFLAMDIVIAMPVSWLPLVADYNRFAKNSNSAARGTIIGFALTNIIFYIGGFILGTGDVFELVAAIQSIFFGFILLILLVDEADNAFADVYSAAVSAQNIIKSIGQHYLIAGFSALGIFLSIVIPIAEYESFLLLIGSVFVPLFGIVISDYYVVRKRSYTPEMLYGKRLKKVGLIAFIAWICGIFIYYLLSPLSLIYLPNLPAIGSTIPSFVASSLIYILLLKIRKD